MIETLSRAAARARRGVRPPLAAAVPAALAVTMLAACAVQAASSPALTPAELTATWASPDGGSIAFAADHSFAASGLRLGKFWSPCAGAGKISVSGMWRFLNSQGDSGATGYSRGSLVDLSFASAAGNPTIGCTGGFLKLTSWNVGSTPGLCLQFDPDTPCDGYIFSKR
jgi:hypothetical protein